MDFPEMPKKNVIQANKKERASQFGLILNSLKAYASEFPEDRIKLMKHLYSFLLEGGKIETSLSHMNSTVLS